MDAELELDLSVPAVVEKYKAAADVANRAIEHVISLCVPGAKIVEICAAGDAFIEDAVKKLFSKQKAMEKGIGFPTCISVNNVVGHFSPFTTDATVLNENDIVKIDLGVHFDGFISQAANTVVVMAQAPESAITGRVADVISACYFAAECAHRLVRPGGTNVEVTEAIKLVAEAFHVNAVQGVLSHQVKRYVMDANKVILNKADSDNQAQDCQFEVNEVYCIDIVMSTGEGKTKEGNAKPFVFKRALDQSYNLKLKNSKTLMNDITKRFSSMGFALRALGDENKVRFGVVELVNHDLVHPFPVLYEKEGEIVAQFKFTVLVLPNSTARLSTFSPPWVTSEYNIESVPRLQEVMAMETQRGKKKKKATTAE